MNHVRQCIIVAGMLAMIPVAAAQERMQIYRCVGANGAVSLRDSPCKPGEAEEIRQVRIPANPPPTEHVEPIAEEPPPPPRAEDVRVVIVQAARPMYECTTPDGDVYTSDDPDGNPRWVPVWTVGYPAFRHSAGPPPSGPPPSGRGGPPPGAARPPTTRGWPMVIGSGTYIRDECQQLPQREVCQRLSDRRYEILRRYGMVSPSERRELDREQQVIDERMANDCRGY